VLEGRVQGALEARRGDVLYVLRTRFGTVPADLETRIARAEEPELLQLLGRVVVVERIEDLML
jgi:hypothetical protein